VGAFAHYLSHLKESQIEKAIDLASEYATLSVQQLGTQSSYPHIDNINFKFRVN
jgi:sugar/nucleoside kinase (ribokinase family)